MREETAKLDIVAGVEGNSIYLNDFRIAGPKPWGGGKVISSWDVRPSDIYKALAAPEPLSAPGERVYERSKEHK